MIATTKALALAGAVTLSTVPPPTPNHSVKVGGTTLQTATVQRSETVADGRNAVAALLVGSVYGPVDVGGRLEQTVAIEEALTLARGDAALASTVVGVVTGADIGGSLEQTVSVDDLSNIAIGNGARACVEIGVIGWHPFCGY